MGRGTPDYDPEVEAVLEAEADQDQAYPEPSRGTNPAEVTPGYLPVAEIVPAAEIVPVAENPDSSQAIVPAVGPEIDQGTEIVLEMEIDQAAVNPD